MNSANEKMPFEVLAEQFCDAVDAIQADYIDWIDPVIACLYDVCVSHPEVFSDPRLASKLEAAINSLDAPVPDKEV